MQQRNAGWILFNISKIYAENWHTWFYDKVESFGIVTKSQFVFKLTLKQKKLYDDIEHL